VGKESKGDSQSMTTKGGKGKPPTNARQTKTSRKSTGFARRRMRKHVRKKVGERAQQPRSGGEGGIRYLQSAKTMSKISLLVNLDETVSVAGVEDLENSWVITGMAIVVKGITITSR